MTHRSRLVATIGLFVCLAAAHWRRRGPAPAAGRRVLAADYSKHRLAMLDSAGKVLWERKVGDIHDLHLLPGGNILFQDGWTHILEVTPGTDGKADKTVWEYDAAKMNGNAGRPVAGARVPAAAGRHDDDRRVRPRADHRGGPDGRSSTRSS